MIIAIDPGLNGAIAYYTTKELHVKPMPTLASRGNGKRDIDGHAVHKLLMPYAMSHIFIEDVHSMPNQGVASSFQFGKSFGMILGIIIANNLTFTLVPPQTWKKKMQVPAAKEAARARASQLLPKYSHLWPLKKDDGKAEAALIALYGHWQEQHS